MPALTRQSFDRRVFHQVAKLLLEPTSHPSELADDPTHLLDYHAQPGGPEHQQAEDQDDEEFAAPEIAHRDRA